MFAISFPGLDALKTIYLSILNGHIAATSLPQAVQKNAEKLVDAAIAMNQKVKLLTPFVMLLSWALHSTCRIRKVSNTKQNAENDKKQSVCSRAKMIFFVTRDDLRACARVLPLQAEGVADRNLKEARKGF